MCSPPPAPSAASASLVEVHELLTPAYTLRHMPSPQSQPCTATEHTVKHPSCPLSIHTVCHSRSLTLSTRLVPSLHSEPTCLGSPPQGCCVVRRGPQRGGWGSVRPCTPTAPTPQAKGSQVAWTPSKSSHQHSADGSSCQLLSADRLIRGWGASWAPASHWSSCSL